jgi:hypothetical protein
LGVFILKIFLCFFLLACARNDFDTFLNNNFTIKTKSTIPLILLGKNSTGNQLLKINIKHVQNYNDALAEIKKSLFLILSQYEFTMAPYPGQITTAINCGSTFHPKLNYKDNVYYISAYANERLALSICQGDMYSFYVSTTYFFDSSSNQLLTIDYYQNKNGKQEDPIKFFNKYFTNLTNINLSEFKDLLK